MILTHSLWCLLEVLFQRHGASASPPGAGLQRKEMGTLSPCVHGTHEMFADFYRSRRTFRMYQ